MENTLKKEKKQHDHKLTKLLKVGIFSLVMLAPFMAIASKVAYTTFNKNAKDSYYGQTINEKTETQITNIEDLKSSDYKFNNNIINLENTNGQFRINIKNFTSDNITNGEQINNIRFYSYPTGNETTIMYAAFYIDNTFFISKNLNLQSIEFYCYIENFTYDNTSYEPFITSFYKISYNKNSYLDNAFYYAIDQLQESELFNWTQNTAIYSGIYGLTNGMGNNNPTMAILLTYWTITTCIYVIFDIIIELFTWLTHLIGER